MQTKVVAETWEVTPKKDTAQGQNWENHILFNINPARNIRDITFSNQATLDKLFSDVYEKVFFYPDFILMNFGGLQNWKNAHAHAVQGARLSPYWSMLDQLNTLKFKYRYFGPLYCPAAIATGRRSKETTDTAYIIDITKYVMYVAGEKYVNLQALCDTLDVIDTVLQGYCGERGSLVIKPQVNKHGAGDTYTIYYVISPADKTGL